MKQNQITAFSTIFEALFSENQLNSLGIQTQMIERFRLITPAKPGQDREHFSPNKRSI